MLFSEPSPSKISESAVSEPDRPASVLPGTDTSASPAEQSGRRRGFPRFLIISAVLCLTAVLLRAAARHIPGFADRYSDLMNPVLVNTLGRLTGLLPFSLAEALILLIPPLVILCLWKRVLIKTACLILSAMFLLFQLNEGIYFSRTTFAKEYGLNRGTYTTEELASVCRYLRDEVNASAPLVTRNAEGIMIADADLKARLRRAMAEAGSSFPYLAGWYPSPKPVLFSGFLNRTDLTGIYSIFTIEANYNRDMPQYNLPFTMGHELSHLKGIMSEKEANFAGYLGCMGSADPDIHYSGAMLGWTYCGNELYRRDYDLWYSIASTLDAAANKDLEYNSDYWDSWRTKVSETAEKVNDTYLKSQGLAEGTLSYDLVVDLIVTYETAD